MTRLMRLLQLFDELQQAQVIFIDGPGEYE